MKIDSEPLDDHQIKLTVEVDTTQFDGVKKQAARKISRRTKIPGFRPGKAPYPVVQRHVGEAALLEEALDLLIDDIYPKVIEESEINPYGPGSLENINSTDPPVLEFVIPLAPEVSLGDYHAISYPYEPEPIQESDIADVLKQVQENQAIIEPVERPAAVGDIVYLVLTGEEILPEKEPDEEDEAEPLSVPEQRLNILIKDTGEEDDSEWPFPDFSRELVDLSAGDEKSITHEYAEDEKNETFAGRTIIFAVTVNDIKSRELPPVDDTLAQSVGDYENLDDLRDYIERTLTENKLEAYHGEYDDKVLVDLIESSSIHYPPQMVQQELEVVLDQLKDRLASQGLDLEIYLKTRDMDQEALNEELLPTAEKRIKRGLVLFEVAKVENLEVKPEEVEKEVSRTIDQIFQIMPEKEARERVSGDAIQNLVGQIMSDKMAQLALKRLRSIASGRPETEEVEETEDEAGLPEADSPDQIQEADEALQEELDEQTPPSKDPVDGGAVSEDENQSVEEPVLEELSETTQPTEAPVITEASDEKNDPVQPVVPELETAEEQAADSPDNPKN